MPDSDPLTIAHAQRDGLLEALKIATRTLATYVTDNLELRDKAARLTLDNQNLIATVERLTGELIGREMAG